MKVAAVDIDSDHFREQSIEEKDEEWERNRNFVVCSRYYSRFPRMIK